MSARRLVSLLRKTPTSRSTRVYALGATPLAALALAYLASGAAAAHVRPHEALSRYVALPRRERIMHKLDDVFYWLVIVPLVAFLPAPLAYRLARLHGDWCYRCYATERGSITNSLDAVLGNQLAPMECASVTRDYYRFRSCEAVDAMRLAGNGHALARLVEMRGLEHIKAALAAGKGAIICSGHFGFVEGGFSLLGIRGFPVTTIVRKPSLPLLQQIVVDLAFRTKYLGRHRHRPDSDWSGDRLRSAAHAAMVLRSNEVLTTCIEPPTPPADWGRSAEVEFLGRRVRLLPGCIALAKSTGAPVLLMFLRRSSDLRHQVLEVSPPVPLDGDTTSALQRCVSRIEVAIRRNPAHWRSWSHPDDALRPLGLLATAGCETACSRDAAV